MVKLYQHCKHHAVLCCSALIGMVLCFTMVNMVRQWQHDWALTQPALTTVNTTADNAAADMITAIPTMHIFGESFAETGPVPISDLELRVTGIVKVNTEENGAASKAYISIEGHPSKVYQTGDALPDGVKIHAMTNDAVILENNGRLEKLPLPRKSLQFKIRDTEAIG